MIDLHTHSNISDGSLAPAALVQKAYKDGLTAIALTDHDSLDGLKEAEEACSRLGLRFIRGIEIDIAFEPGEFHLLGLDLGQNTGAFDHLLAQFENSREKRNLLLIGLLQKEGFDISYDDVKTIAGPGVIGRPHIAETLVKKRLVKTKQEAFDKYLGKGRALFVKKESVELAEAIKAIKASGGLVIVAHPMSLFVSWTRLRTMFGEWKELGIDGIEAFHPAARIVDCNRLDSLAKEFGFKVSAGSDFHGEARPDRRLGYTAGNKAISQDFLKIFDS